MDSINFTKNQFNKFKLLDLRGIINSEATMFILPVKNKWRYDDKLVKRLFITEGEEFSNKLYTINSLLSNKDKFDESFVLPEKLVSVDEKLIGFMLPYIKGENLGLVLNSHSVEPKVKKEYLKKIGNLLKKIESMNKYNNSNFHIGDLHENNFIIDEKTDELKVVDLDSCKIGGNNPFASKYLSYSRDLERIPSKYHKQDRYIVADANSDLFCYNIMLLNYIYSDNVRLMDLDMFYDYLEYLKTKGFNSELLDCFNRLYDNGDNINPVDLIDSIPDDPCIGHHMTYKMSKGRFY